MESSGPACRVVVFNGGAAPTALPPGVLAAADLFVAADSGLETAAALGVSAHVAVGDFDSVAPDVLEAARQAGSRVVAHPTDKDQTDIELAIDEALAAGATRITVVGGDGGRLDHHLASLLLLGSARLADVVVEAYLRDSYVTVVRGTTQLEGRVGDLLSLLPLHGAAVGVRASGVRWPLDGSTLRPGTTRGVSNELVEESATVSVEAGLLAAIAPASHLTRPDIPDDPQGQGFTDSPQVSGATSPSASPPPRPTTNRRT